MPSRTLPNVNLKGGWANGENGWDVEHNANLVTISSLLQCAVASATTVLPGSPSEGDMYIVRSDDVTNPNKIAVYDNSAWLYITPKDGWRAWVADVAELQVYTTAGGWAAVSGGGGGSVGVSDEGTLVLAAPTNINFVGAGVTTTDDGDGTLTVTIPGGGGSGGYSFIYNPDMSTGTSSSSTNAAKGNCYTVNEACSLVDVLARVANAATNAHKIVVVRYDSPSGTRTIQEVLAETTPRTAAGEYFFEKFGSPIALSAGWHIGVFCVRTDGTGTSATNTYSGTRGPTDLRSEIEIAATLIEPVTTFTVSDTHSSAGSAGSVWSIILGLSS